uniref:Pre-mRNA splicing Prp18-interacting factor n=1 Tax=Tanacetum cinerariifolium TaxID=118510 RepID=A0A6L2KJH0_TANCI|nr:hypothetical protein [Tanacetum cinerariifolium]
MSDYRVFCRPCTCERCRRNYTDKFCSICCFEFANAFIDDLIAKSVDGLSNSSDHPPQHQTHSFESYNDNPNYGYPPQEPFVYNQDSCYEQNFVDNSQKDIHELLRKLLKDLQIINEELAEYINSLSWNCPTFYDDDDDEYSIQYRVYLENSSDAITPNLPNEEPDNSLSMGDENLSTIPETESDEIIKSSVENLVPIPSESEGISDDTCDVPFCDNSPPLDVLNDHFELFFDFNDVCTSSNDDSFEDIKYVEASPPDSELVSLEEVQDDILREKLLNINLLIVKIESLNDNFTPDYNPLPKFETFSDHTEETRRGSTTTHVDNSLLEYDSFLFEIEPDQGELTSVVMKDIFREPHVHVPNVLPTHPTLMLDSDFMPSDDSFGSDLEVSFPSGTRNKIFDPGIFFKVQSKRFLSLDTFSISFIHNLLCTLRETLLPFSSKNEEKVFNPGILLLTSISSGQNHF